VAQSGPVDVRFADCELSLDRFELRRDGAVVDIEPQVFDVLAHLVRNRDRVVPKNELLDEIWGDRFVSESALTSRIKFARRAIGDTGRDQRLIKTVHGRGYRFVGDVTDVDPTAPTTPPISAGRRGGPEPSVRSAAQATGVGGEHELVDHVLAALADGRGMAVALGSPHRRPATEALERLYDEVVDHGYLAARASASGAGMRPYGCVIDAVDELLVREPGLAKALPAACQAELDRCLSGEPPSTRQRLFLALRELLVAGAAERGIVLLFDEVDLAGPDTVALIEHTARLTRRHRVVVAVAHAGGTTLGGPFVELAVGDPSGGDREAPPAWDLPPAMTEALTRVAVGGPRFDVVELRAAGKLDGLGADHLLDVALARGVVEPLVGGHFQFTDPSEAARRAGSLAPHRRDAVRRETAAGLADEGAAPERVAEHLLAIHDPAAAVPAAVEAASRAAEARAYGDVLRWADAVVDHASGDERLTLLTLRARALAAMGEPSAVAAYRQALALASPQGARRLRAELARAALFAGDFDTARDALEGLEPDGGPDDVAIVLAKGGFAYFTGELDAAEDALEALRGTTFGPGPSTSMIDTIALQGLVAHDRGQWFDRLRRELVATRERPDLVATIFDSHLCVAEYLLYGPMPYEEVVALAGELRRHAEQVGARRAAAFAVCVAGEAELLAGDLDAARRDLEESLELHQRLSADAGTAHTLQRLAELELACGDRAKAIRLLREALPLARWSPLSNHLLQRIYGTLIAAQPDAATAMEAADEAIEIVDAPTACEFCGVMVEVPATIAYATGGRLDAAREHLQMAEAVAARWHGTAWKAAVCEARAVLARAEGDDAGAVRLFADAAALFEQAGQVLDAERCREAADA
jgi:DNA-binding winged helix-turn-helix (wHTH) protein/tetratricopeptide (TPR) repeat protein